MSAPQRIQRVRGRRWKPPEGALYVGRPSAWGNPFRISRSSEYHGLPGSWFLMGEDGQIHHPDVDTQQSARHKAVELYAQRLFTASDAQVRIEQIRTDLAGRDLVCWCPRGEPCHADVLLEVANAPVDAAPPPVRWSQPPRLRRNRSSSEGDVS